MQYENYGPFEVPRIGTLVDRNQINDFWGEVEEEHTGLATAKGFYVFSMRAGKGIRPWYVGVSNGNNGFRNEIFQHHKITHYNECLQQKGTPLISLIAGRTGTGKKFRGSISKAEREWIEKYLISLALAANPNIKNKKDTKVLRTASIPGIINSPVGKSGSPTTELRKILNLS